MLFIREVTLSSSSCSNISSIHNNRSAPLKCIPTRSTWIAILVDWLPVCLLSKYKYEQRNKEVEEEGGEYLEIAQDLPLYCLSSSALWEVEAALLRCDWCRYRKSSGFISGDKRKYLPLEIMYHLLIFALAGRQQQQQQLHQCQLPPIETCHFSLASTFVSLLLLFLLWSLTAIA